ncbi:myocardin-like isoform X2 [Spea bombifrons]|uniref:myocardin-like isoform X2 n=1 Tax=Spea bombifrons TaxID=233779 RepID=UPI002348F9CE|nr:myocardin-like isoform X2 [Spea bombifrons]
MTLLASERSLLIRSKFRSVLQLRMQHRRSQEQMSERNVISTLNKTESAFPEQNGNMGQSKTEDLMKYKNQNKLHKVAAVKMHFCEDKLVESEEFKEKKARLAEDLNEKILHRPGPLELVKKNILPLAAGVKDGMKDQIQISSSSDTFSFDDDISSSSSSSTSSSPRFAPSPGLSVNLSPTSTSPVFQLDLPQISEEREPITGTVAEVDSLATNRATTHQPVLISAGVPKVSAKPSDMGKSQRQKKLKDAKPKVKKLKYHQYIPPDQKVDRSPVAMDSAYSRLLQQQQIFLQLQILNQQQNQTFCVQTVHPLTTSFTGATQNGAPTINLSPPPGTASVTTAASSPTTSPNLKPEVLPANLDELTVSELRQHLRKRGLPVSGTKPALLERLRPYQISRTKAIPIQSAHLITPVIELPSFPNPPTCDNTPATLCTFRTLPSPASFEAPRESTNPSCSVPENVDSPEGMQDKDMHTQGINEDQVLLEKQKVIENLTWKLQQEQKQAEDLRVELEMHKRLKKRRKNEKFCPRLSIKTEEESTSSKSCCAKAQTEETNFLYTLNNGRPELQPPVVEPLSNSNDNNSYMVFCPPSCDLIGQDFELPMQITASPESPVQKPLSFEEELQEAIQKAQMALCQSIEDILQDEPLMSADELMHVDSNITENLKSEMEQQNAMSPATPTGNFSKAFHNFSETHSQIQAIPTSGILEFPVSGHYDFFPGQDSLSVIFSPDQMEMPPSPQSENTISPSSSASSRVPFDPADWLEALTSGSTSSFGPSSPTSSSIFSTDVFDSPDLSINRMIDLMVEQW